VNCLFQRTFAVRDGLVADKGFRLAPLGPQHNEAGYAAWTDCIDHIHHDIEPTGDRHLHHAAGNFGGETAIEASRVN
jgi:hypothetical protein